MSLKAVATLLALAASARIWGAAPDRPACNKHNAGQMWPNAANHDHQLVSKLARCGELQMCVRDVWRYRWTPLTVRLDQLRGGQRFQKPAGCEIPVEPDGKVNETASATAR
jgi:hypothetical protein